MGQTLSQPITEKHSTSGADDRYLYAVSEMQGWRISMEDAHTTVLRLGDDDPNTFFAVYDGHGGSSVARYAGRNVHKQLVSTEGYVNGHYGPALKQAFLRTDEDMRADPAFSHDPAGCTAVAALITHGSDSSPASIYVANAGDSRAVLSTQGSAKPLSFDHKPQNEQEAKRIRAAGGYIEYGRVNGNLSLSRALGDFEFKKNYALGPERQVVTADPDITAHEITQEDEFVVLACDGIWDCLSSQQVVNIVRRQVAEGKTLPQICELVLDRCLAHDTGMQGGIGCDNMTMVIVALLGGRTRDEWYAWVRDRVESAYGFATPAALPDLYPHHRTPALARNFAAPASRVTRTVTGGIAFYPSSSMFDEGSAVMYQEYDSSDDEFGAEALEEEEGGSRAIVEINGDDAEDLEGLHELDQSAAALLDDSGLFPFRLKAPNTAKRVDTTLTEDVAWHPPPSSASISTEVDAGHANHDGAISPSSPALLGAQGACNVVGSPVVPSPEPLTLLGAIAQRRNGNGNGGTKSVGTSTAPESQPLPPSTPATPSAASDAQPATKW